jgi:hypothetical protein
MAEHGRMTLDIEPMMDLLPAVTYLMDTQPSCSMFRINPLRSRTGGRIHRFRQHYSKLI